MDGQRALSKVEHDAAADGGRAEEIARFRRGATKLSILFLGFYFAASAAVHASLTYFAITVITAVFGAWVWTRKPRQ